MKKVDVIIEKTETGFSAYVDSDNAEVCTTGKTIEETKTNFFEALELYNEGLPEAYKINKDWIDFI